MGNVSYSRRRSVGQDLLLAVLLWIMDAAVGSVVLLASLASIDGYNMFEPDPQVSLMPAIVSVAIFAVVVLVSAIGLHRLGYRVSVYAQAVVGTALLLFCAAGASGYVNL
ncbi:DUF6234 family protein [Streptomyces sp. NPDC050610]|uniref:DUF6234 family protein n=1 Tax=Streptomyces sp. NPDC050610 TaxID=3157097 RepID=UPI00342F49CB